MKHRPATELKHPYVSTVHFCQSVIERESSGTCTINLLMFYTFFNVESNLLYYYIECCILN